MDTLFDGTTKELRKFIPGLIANFTIKEALTNLLDSTAGRVLPQFLGEVIATQISQGGSSDDAVLRRAFALAQEVVARLAFAEYLPFAEVQIGDDGITVTATENRRAAFDYQTQKIDRELREGGWQKLDELLKLVAGNASLFPAWAATAYNQELAHSLFKSAAEFSKFYGIQDKWLTFWALRPYIQAIEDNQGDAATSRLNALPNSVTAEQRGPLKRNLLRALAYQAVIAALPNLSVEVAGASVQLNYTSQYGGVRTYYTPPGREMLDWVSGNLQKQADLFYHNFEDGLTRLSPQPAADDADSLGLIEADGSLIML